jgi:YHS domain-containing protein
MLRQLAWAVLVVLVAWLARGLLRPRRGAAPAGGRVGPTSEPQKMVRDRVCNTFLPESRALSLTAGGQTHFFCSERCRQSFLAGQ